jgi:hypothetical protein
MKEVKEYVTKLSELLPVGSTLSIGEMEKRAGAFLAGMSTLTNIKHEFSKEKIRLLTVQNATYSAQMAKGTAKTVTENKLAAEASKEYTEAREQLETVDNDLAYLKAYYDIFMAAHVFYRNMAKGDGF